MPRSGSVKQLTKLDLGPAAIILTWKVHAALSEKVSEKVALPLAATPFLS